jgi:hypothetical protein
MNVIARFSEGRLLFAVLTLCGSAQAQNTEPRDLNALATATVQAILSARAGLTERSQEGRAIQSVKALAVLPTSAEVFVVACAGAVDQGLERLIALRMRTDGTLISQRTSDLDSFPGRCYAVGVVRQPTRTRPWPPLEIRYRSRHDVGGGTAIVDWGAVFESDVLQLIRRVPTRVALTRPGKPPELEVLDVIPATESTADLRIRGTDKRIVVACGATCIVEPEAVLALWR